MKRTTLAAVGFAFLTTLSLLAQAPATAPATTQQPQRGAGGRGGGSVLAILDTLPQAPSHARIQTRTYDFKEAGRPMNYELFIPSKYDASKPTPLVVALHCLGAEARHMIRYEGLTEEAEARGWLVVSPMGYNSRGWYGSRGTGRTGGGGGGGTASGDPENLGELSEKDVMNVFEIVRTEFNVDPKRMYLMGHSMGGGGTWYLGLKHPELWAALGVAAPAIYSSPDQLSAITSTPVIAVQGDQDALVDVKVTRTWVEKMKTLGMRHKYIEIAGGDHMAVIARSPGNMRQVFEFFDTARRN